MERDWTPVKKGEVYCSPACGFGCKHDDYEKAVERAKALAERCSFEIGGKWYPKVHENLGWHWCVCQEGTEIEIRFGGYLSKGTGYTVGLAGGTPSQVAVQKLGGFETPKQAYDAQVFEIERESRMWRSVLEKVVQPAEPKPDTVYVVMVPEKGPVAARLTVEEAERVRDRVQESLEFSGSRRIAYVKELNTKE